MTETDENGKMVRQMFKQEAQLSILSVFSGLHRRILDTTCSFYFCAKAKSASIV
jgi:hypothetical protein